MKVLRIAVVLAAASLATAGCATSYGQGPSAAAPNPMANFSSMVSGIFRGSTPGNELTLDVQNAGLLADTNAFNLFLTASGRYQGTNVRDTGLLHVENQGRNVGITYIPHFDPTVSGLSADATRFTPSEIRSACNLVLEPSGDGYAGETQGTTSCAFAIHGATGKWTVEVDAGQIRLRSVQSGETLRFQRSAR